MSDAPERIFASRDEQDGWRWPRASKFPEQGPRENIEYRRADLPPTLAEALAVPEVKALVEAVKAAFSCEMIPKSTAKNGGASAYASAVIVADMLRAALRAVERD